MNIGALERELVLRIVKGPKHAVHRHLRLLHVHVSYIHVLGSAPYTCPRVSTIYTYTQVLVYFTCTHLCVGPNMTHLCVRPNTSFVCIQSNYYYFTCNHFLMCIKRYCASSGIYAHMHMCMCRYTHTPNTLHITHYGYNLEARAAERKQQLFRRKQELVGRQEQMFGRVLRPPRASGTWRNQSKMQGAKGSNNCSHRCQSLHHQSS